MFKWFCVQHHACSTMTATHAGRQTQTIKIGVSAPAGWSFDRVIGRKTPAGKNRPGLSMD
jgi:hypothetical protein